MDTTDKNLKSNKRGKEEKILFLKPDKRDGELRVFLRRGGFRYHIKGALPGEEVKAEIERYSGMEVFCNLKTVLKASEKRVAPACRYYGRCGGCDLLHEKYESQTEAKTELVRKALGVPVSDCVQSSPKESRNKAHLAFGRSANKNHDVKNPSVKSDIRTTLGFFNSETHRVVDVPECLCHGAWYPVLYKTLLGWAQKYHVSVYEPEKGTGTLRFAAARVIEKCLLLTLVATADKLPGMAELYKELQKSFGAVSLWLNVNKSRTNQIFSPDFIHMAGQKAIEGELCGVSFELSPDSFFQVNTEIARRIYSFVLDLMKESGAETVVDAFSGIGITSVLFAKHFKKVISIELSKSAVANARKTAQLNGVDNIDFRCADAAKLLPTLKLSENCAFFVDPPRAGLGEAVCRSIVKFSPATVIYLSCNPETLAEDLAYLTSKGYKINTVRPYDMFPGTKHVETVVMMSRVSN